MSGSASRTSEPTSVHRPTTTPRRPTTTTASHGTDADLAAIARLLADESRARMCLALMNGRAWTASELAAAAGIGRSTASEHIARLTDGGLVSSVSQGRHRYVRLRGPEIAEALEPLLALAPHRPITSLRESSRARSLAGARMCYDHLAGRLGVGLTESLVHKGFLESSLGPTGLGWAEFGQLGIDRDGLERARRPVVRPCLDWTERRTHLAGGLGAALASRLVELGWLTRAGDGRAVRLTPHGVESLRDRFGLTLDRP